MALSDTKIVGSGGKYPRNTASDAYPWYMNEQGALMVAPISGAMTEAAMAGRLFYAANQAGIASSAALTAAYLGVCVSNPAGNSKNLIIRAVGAALIVKPAAADVTLHLTGGYTAAGVVTHTSALVYGTAFSSLRQGR
jgi:hypothetical protein